MYLDIRAPYPILLSDLNGDLSFSTDFVKVPNIKFHQNPSNESCPVIQGDRREPDVFEMASRRLLCEGVWGTSGSWPRYTMPFQ